MNDENALRTQIDDLLALIYEKSEAFKASPHDPLARQLAAAGLMRCCATLRGICILEDQKMAPIAGVLERHHWETWLVSLYLLLGGNEAFEEVKADDIYWRRLLSESLKLGLSYQKDWKGKPKKIMIKKLNEKVRELLVKQGERIEPDSTIGYDATYRVQSLFAAHANLATIRVFLDDSDSNVWRVHLNPDGPFPRITQTPALDTAHLGVYVFRSFGLPVDRVEAIGLEIYRLASPRRGE